MSARDKEVYRLSKLGKKADWDMILSKFPDSTIGSLQAGCSRYKKTLPREITEKEILNIPRPAVKKINSKAFLTWLRMQKEFEELSNRYIKETRPGCKIQYRRSE